MRRKEEMPLSWQPCWRLPRFWRKRAFPSLEEAGFSSLEEELLCEEETGFSSLEDAAEEAGFSTLEELPALSEVPFEEEEAGFSSWRKPVSLPWKRPVFLSSEEDVSSLEEAGLSSLEEALELLNCWSCWCCRTFHR